MKRNFRKSYQANLAKTLNFICVDIDAKGLHANLVLACLNKKRKLNWDDYFSGLVSHTKSKYKFFNSELFERIGINRDSVKEHILAIINGRSINMPYTALFPESLKDDNMIFLKKSRKKVSRSSYLLNVVVKEFFNQSDLVKDALVFRDKIGKMNVFMGSCFPAHFSLAKKINFVVQSFESLLFNYCFNYS